MIGSEQHIFEASQLATKSVIVYCDRAEVKRQITVDLTKGTHEIVIQNVSAVIERQSVRVDGHGVLIQEVQYQEMANDMSTENEKIVELERSKLDLETERFCLDDECISIQKRIEVLDGVASQISSGPSPGPVLGASNPSLSQQPLMTRRHTVTEPPSPGIFAGDPARATAAGFFSFNHESLDNLAKFLKYYADTVRDMKLELRRKQRESEHLAERIEQIERHVDQLRCGAEYDSVKRNISIVVEMEEPNTVDLFITYQVYCASWKPAYDIRASTAEDHDQNTSVQLCYYGLVEQNTGDDWNNCELVLSTCSASLGGSPPHLGTLSASLASSRIARRHAAASATARRNKAMSAPSEEDMGFGSFDYEMICDAAALQHRLVNNNFSTKSSDERSVSLLGVESTVSTCFAIPRNVTIVSNGAEHKLLISKTDLSCAFSHETVPSKSTNAFLSALITNTSSLPLLPGPAAVYVNNCYVTKTHLRLVPPGSEFRCNMGVDASIKVEYKTPTVNYDQVGFMSKSTLMSHEQLISVRNAKVRHSVRITIKEQIPKSHDDKIKVAVASPEVRISPSGSSKKETSEARLNKDHNLEWSIVLAPGQHRNLPIKYTVEYPAAESISYRFT